MNINIITYTFFNSIQLLLNLLCFGFDSANCYNEEPVSLQYAAIALQTPRHWCNIAPITFQIYVLCMDKKRVFNCEFAQPNGICTAGQRSGFSWPVLDVL